MPTKLNRCLASCGSQLQSAVFHTTVSITSLLKIDVDQHSVQFDFSDTRFWHAELTKFIRVKINLFNERKETAKLPVYRKRRHRKNAMEKDLDTMRGPLNKRREIHFSRRLRDQPWNPCKENK